MRAHEKSSGGVNAKMRAFTIPFKATIVRIIGESDYEADREGVSISRDKCRIRV
jgi:hypothetical protein